MGDHLSLKEIVKGPKRGEVVYVRTVGLWPHIQGIYQIKKRKILSNFPYRIDHEGVRQLIEKHEVQQLGKISEHY